MSRVPRLLVWALAGALVASGCVPGRTVLEVSIEPSALAKPVNAHDFTTHESAVRGIAAIMTQELRLPVPDEVTVYVYATRELFEQGLMRDGGVSRRRAAEFAAFASGVGKRRQLLINDGAVEVRGRDWLQLLAHELTHVAQIELARGEGRYEQWLAEGMAEWVAFAVLERLGIDAVAERRAVARLAMRSHPPVVGRRLDLRSLGTPRGFPERHRAEGLQPTYQLAFVMADYLIEQHGLRTLVTYFRLCGSGLARDESFRLAFGLTVAEFEVKVLDSLAPPGR